MEKEGVVPDVVIPQHPDELARGVDAQLDKAVEVLTADVAVWKKTRQPVVTSGGTSAPVVTAPPMSSAPPPAPTPPGGR
jgi:C-terminal processing protease CtpA/Prc